MKKTFVFLSFLLILAGNVFAVGEAAKGKDIITIKYAFWGNPDAIGVEKDIIDAFEKSHPHIKVVPVVAAYEEYHPKLMTMISGGMAPDVMRIDSYFFKEFCSLGALASLEPFIKKSGFDTSIYAKAAIDEATVNGEVYALPWGTAPIYCALNLDVFKKAGIELPTYDWTLSDFVRIVKKFGGERTGIYGFASTMNSSNPADNFISFIWANGGNLFTEDLKGYALDSRQAIEAVQMIADLYQGGYLPKDMISTTSADVLVRWFTTGTLAMMPATAQQILSIQKVEGVNFEAYPFPGGAVKNATVVKSNEVAIAAASKQKDAAWEFLKFLRGNEGERYYCAARRIPPSLNNDPTLWELYLDPKKSPHDIKKATDTIYAKYGRQLPLRNGYSEIQSYIIPVFQHILSGDITAERGLKVDIKAKVEEVLARKK